MEQGPVASYGCPRLRPLETRWVEQAGRRLLHLRDPLQLSGRDLLVPGEMAPLLAVCDGTRDPAAMRTALLLRHGRAPSPVEAEALLRELDEALLLEGPRFRAAWRGAMAAYRQAPCRPPALAGSVYPADPAELARTLDGYCAGVPPADGATPAPVVAGILSPHIDYARGHQVYASLWQQAQPGLAGFDTAVLFGTDHSGGPGRVTVTRQHYATPWGVVPTDQEAVEALARALGEEAATGEELHHAREHSIELALVWLHRCLLGAPPPRLVPVLLGHMEPFLRGERDPGSDDSYGLLLETLASVTRGRKVLVVASADLAHVGPAFGDSLPLGLADRARLRARDAESLRAICAGDADAFFQGVRAEGDRRRICGTAPVYLALRLLGRGVAGRATGYAQCPADRDGGSLVSVAGVLWHGATRQVFG